MKRKISRIARKYVERALLKMCLISNDARVMETDSYEIGHED
jgi:hypothetical protein